MNGRVIAFPRHLEWREWLIEELIIRGWDPERASFLIRSLRFTSKTAEVGIRTHGRFLPKDLIVNAAWGFMLFKDHSPSENTLEVN
jgi:hypothetical protein